MVLCRMVETSPNASHESASVTSVRGGATVTVTAGTGADSASAAAGAHPVTPATRAIAPAMPREPEHDEGRLHEHAQGIGEGDGRA